MSTVARLLREIARCDEEIAECDRYHGPRDVGVTLGSIDWHVERGILMAELSHLTQSGAVTDNPKS